MKLRILVEDENISLISLISDEVNRLWPFLTIRKSDISDWLYNRFHIERVHVGLPSIPEDDPEDFIIIDFNEKEDVAIVANMFRYRKEKTEMPYGPKLVEDVIDKIIDYAQKIIYEIRNKPKNSLEYKYSATQNELNILRKIAKTKYS
jgi:hypothetical protein